MHVAICTYKPADGVIRMLEGLAACSMPEDLECVWLLENGTASSTFRIPNGVLDRLPLRYECLGEPGQARSRQWLVDKLRKGPVVFLDDDITVSPELLAAYSAAASRYEKAHVFGGPLSVELERQPPSWLVEHLPLSVRGWHLGNDEKTLGQNGWFNGCNFAAFAEDILAVGGFNVGLGPGGLTGGAAHNPTGHENELQDRLREMGCKFVYLPRARVFHHVPASNCTASWALHRVYRQAVTTGARQYSECSKVPRWMWRKIITGYLRGLISVVLWPRANRFLYARSYYYWKGILMGRRLVSRGRITF